MTDSKRTLDTATQLEAFINRWIKVSQEEEPDNLLITYDADWPSNCYCQKPTTETGETLDNQESKQVAWLPIKQDKQDMFNRLADALEIEIHPDIITYYTLYWSEHIATSTVDGELTLLQVWNQDDMERLRGNLLGHALNQRKRKQEISFFFAVTSPDDGMLTLNNNSGEVWFEYPGKKPIRKIADSLSEFLATLHPKE